MASVNVTEGILRGSKLNTDSGIEYYEFLGIPYAKPPVGDLKFKSPQQPECWENERDATKIDKNKISCQLAVGTGKLMGSEDCLYLNVFTPNLHPKTPLPVLVYIHGGGYVTGNGTIKSENGPDFLIENDIVVVTINYRLGIFGFLSLDIPEVPGNMGLKDQIKALQWVRDNIRHFGGDSNSVTLMGNSAGAASVEYLMLSPAAKGLFHRGILQSGSALNHWVCNRQSKSLTQQLLKSLNYQGPIDDQHSILSFLMTVSPQQLMRSASSVTSTVNNATNPMYVGFVPTIEKDFGNDDAIITTSPYKLLKEGNFYKVPVMKSFCNREGILMRMSKPRHLKNVVTEKSFSNFWAEDIEPQTKKDFNAKFTNLYRNVSGKEEEEVIEEFFGDLDFVSGIWLSAKLMSKHVPVYVSQFNYEGSINFFKKMFRVDAKGTFHSDDISYTWKINALNDPDENDVTVRKRMTKMYSDFAKIGKPVPDTSELVPVSWPVFTEDSLIYLNFDTDLSQRANYEPEKMALFENLYNFIS